MFNFWCNFVALWTNCGGYLKNIFNFFRLYKIVVWACHTRCACTVDGALILMTFLVRGLVIKDSFFYQWMSTDKYSLNLLVSFCFHFPYEIVTTIEESEWKQGLARVIKSRLYLEVGPRTVAPSPVAISAPLDSLHRILNDFFWQISQENSVTVKKILRKNMASYTTSANLICNLEGLLWAVWVVWRIKKS